MDDNYPDYAHYPSHETPDTSAYAHLDAKSNSAAPKRREVDENRQAMLQQQQMSLTRHQQVQMMQQARQHAQQALAMKPAQQAQTMQRSPAMHPSQTIQQNPPMHPSQTIQHEKRAQIQQAQLENANNVGVNLDLPMINDPQGQLQTPTLALNEIFKHSTISEDQSVGSDLSSRLLIAIAQSEDAGLSNQLPKQLNSLDSKDSYPPNQYSSPVYYKPRSESGADVRRNPDQVESFMYYNPSTEFGADVRRTPHQVGLPMPMRPHLNPHQQPHSLSQPMFTHSRGSSPQSAASNVLPDFRRRSDLMTQASADESKGVNTISQVNISAEKPTGALDNIDPSTQGLTELRQYIATLQGKAQQLEKLQQANIPKRYQILYNIKRSMETALYLDHPEWAQGDSTIKSCRPLRNLDLYLEQNKGISFLIYRTFDDTKRGAQQMVECNTPSDCINSENPDGPTPQRECIEPIAPKLRDALHRILQSRPEYVSLLEQYQKSRVVDAPYLFMYHGRSRWEKLLTRFSSRTQEQLRMFADYVFQYYGDEYAAAEEVFSQGNVTPAFMKYLFVPGEILISRKNSDCQGYMSNSWPKFSYRRAGDRDRSSDNINGTKPSRHLSVKLRPKSDVASGSDDDNFDSQHAVLQRWLRLGHESAGNQTDPDSCSVKTWRWGFDTKFKKQYETLDIKFPRLKSDEMFYNQPIRVEKLEIFPLRFASKLLVEQRKHRGKMFWQCRERCLVSYVEQEGEIADDRSDERYMIDQKTFQVLNPSNTGFNLPAAINPKDELSADQLERDEPPDEYFQYLLPLTIKGYNLRRKKWYDVAVDRISPVVWNKQVFETLVMDRKSKDLIQALISKQVSSQKSTDLIVGKGNGLILLLHGGPGTGKTLTAESVAEIAEKPLYRVTCGDVGTKAEDVEKYLESVLHLGKIWDCVVLLDEADVFLEQRSLEDLQRNALVSVFLRILEYHEGILILTSNRVGTFDEAFRSRIQLALHYPSLRPFQRQRIWQNFFNRLDSFKDDMVDIDNLRDHLEELEKFEMNGRQIRNVITTARQYAEWKEIKLDYECLKDVIEISGKFDTYLTKLKGGMSYDQIAEDEGFR